MEVERGACGQLFGALSPEQLEQQVAPGKNTPDLLLGHLQP